MSAGIDARTGLVELDRDECLRLLGRGGIGRLAVVADGEPMIFPVNYTLDGDAVVFRTDAGAKLDAARLGPVAFECDSIDRMYHIGWSVVVSGHAEEVRAPDELARLMRLPLGPWSAGPKPVWLRIRPSAITGRRIPAHGAAPDDSHTTSDSRGGE